MQLYWLKIGYVDCCQLIGKKIRILYHISWIQLNELDSDYSKIPIINKVRITTVINYNKDFFVSLWNKQQKTPIN